MNNATSQISGIQMLFAHLTLTKQLSSLKILTSFFHQHHYLLFFIKCFKYPVCCFQFLNKKTFFNLIPTYFVFFNVYCSFFFLLLLLLVLYNNLSSKCCTTSFFSSVSVIAFLYCQLQKA